MHRPRPRLRPTTHAAGCVPAHVSARTLVLGYILALLVAPAAGLHAQAPSDEWLTRPVGGDVYQSYLALFGYDRGAPLELRVTDRDETDGMLTERIRFASASGVPVTARFARAATGDWVRRPAVVQLHGGSGAGKDAPSSVLMSEYLVRQGFNVLSIDMLHFGERRTGLMTTFTEQDKHDRLYNDPSAYLNWVVETVKDASRAVDVLLAQYGADPSRIALIGYSRGGTVGAVVGAAEQRFQAVALIYGTHFDALETGHLPAACPANYIGRISPRPLLMINGIYDADHVRETQVEPLYRLARQPKRMVWAETGHQLPTPEHRELMADWLRERLR
jgi:dienelactone hydrolase